MRFTTTWTEFKNKGSLWGDPLDISGVGGQKLYFKPN